MNSYTVLSFKIRRISGGCSLCLHLLLALVQMYNESVINVASYSYILRKEPITYGSDVSSSRFLVLCICAHVSGRTNDHTIDSLFYSNRHFCCSWSVTTHRENLPVSIWGLYARLILWHGWLCYHNGIIKTVGHEVISFVRLFSKIERLFIFSELAHGTLRPSHRDA